MAWIYGFSSILHLLFYVGALGFIASRHRRHPQAAKMAMLGVGVMLLLHIVASVLPLALSNLIDSESWLLYNGLIQTLLTVARLAAFGLILAAVFVGRQPIDADDEPFPAERTINPNDNPYVPPLSR